MIDHVDWKAVAAELDDLGVASAGTVLPPAQCRALAELYDDDERFRSTIDMARHRFGEGAVPVLRPSAPRRRRRAARRLLAAPAPDRPGLGGTARPARRVARLLRGLAGAVSPRRAGPPHSPAPALRPGRVERVTPRPVRRSRLPAAGRHRPRRPGRRLHRRRVPRRREPHAGPVPRHDGAHRPGRSPGLHHPRPAGEVGARLVGRFAAPRRQRAALRPAHARSASSSTTPPDISAGQATRTRPSATNDAWRSATVSARGRAR